MNWAAARHRCSSEARSWHGSRRRSVRPASARGRFVVIEGPAGIGKTALLAAARAAAADERDVRPSVAGHRARARVRLRRRAATRRAAARGSIRARARRAAAVDRRRGGRPARAPRRTRCRTARSRRASIRRSRSCTGSTGCVRTSPPRRRVCMVIDDAHWADAPSLRFLAFLLTRLDELPMALIVATRPREAGTDADLLAAVMTDQSAEVVRIPPLTRAAVARLVESTLGGEPDPAFVDACLRATRGTPFLVRELVDALSEERHRSDRRGGPARRADRRSDGRPLDSVSASPAARVGRTARAGARDPRAERASSGRAACGARRGRGRRSRRAARQRRHPRARPPTDVHPSDRPQRALLRALEAERAQGHREAALLLAEQPGSAGARRPAPARERAGSRRVERRAVARRGSHGHPDRGSRERRPLSPQGARGASPRDQRSSILLALGYCGGEGRPRRVAFPPRGRGRVRADDAARVDAAIVLGVALSRAQCPAAAVDVLDRAAASLDREIESGACCSTQWPPESS